MTDSDMERWALNDDELEALITGATPHDIGRVGNPVAEFFADARSGRGIRPPVPDAGLDLFFAGGATGSVPTVVSSERPPAAPAPDTPTRAMPTTAHTQEPWHDNAPAPSRGGEAPARRAGYDPYGMAPPTRNVPGPRSRGDRQPSPTRPAPQAPAPQAPAVLGSPAPREAAPLRGRDRPSPSGSLLSSVELPSEPGHHHYLDAPEPGVGDYLAQAVQPTGAKVLIGAATVLLLLAVGQLVGVLNLPFGGGSGVENQAIGSSGLSASEAPAEAQQAPIEDPPAGALTTFATLAVPDDDAASSTSESTETTRQVAPAQVTTTQTTAPAPDPVPTSEETTSTSEAPSSTTEDTPSTTEAPTSTSEQETTSTSEQEPTSTSEQETSSTSEDTTTTTEDTTTTSVEEPPPTSAENAG